MSETHGISLTLRVLRRSPNRAATAALAAAVTGAEPELRHGAVRTLSEKADLDAQTALLRVIGEAPADAQQVAQQPDVSKRMREAVIAAIRGDDTPLATRACHYAIDARLLSVLPVMVEQAMIDDHPYGVGLAIATLRLCREMADQLESRSANAAGGVDPSFYRTATLQRLNEAAERFGEHRRLELLEALLHVTTRDNPKLVKLLKTVGHACHDALVEGLGVSHSSGAMDVLINAVLDGDAPMPLVEIAAARCDKPFVARLAEQVGYPLGVRARENTARVQRFAWMGEDERGGLLKLTPQQQAAAIELAVCTAAPASERLRFLRFALKEAAAEARAAACHLLQRFDVLDVGPLIGESLDDESSGVVAAAAKQIRSRGVPGAEQLLISLLEHPAESVRRVAQTELHELNLAAYREMFKRLPESSRQAAGRLVARADPDAPGQLASDLQRPIVHQRLDALAMIEAMGLVDHLPGQLAEALNDPDLAVRAEAARLLGGATEPDEMVVGALLRAGNDSNRTVRAAAQESLGTLRSLEVAATLIERLQTEFESGGVDDEDILR